jgi:hypothetical protein
MLIIDKVKIKHRDECGKKFGKIRWGLKDITKLKIRSGLEKAPDSALMLQLKL